MAGFTNATHAGSRLPIMRPLLLMKVAAGLAGWLSAVAYLTVLFCTADGGVCTSWGCRPSWSALPLHHVFWLALLAPPAVATAVVGPPRLVKRVAVVLVILSLSYSVLDTANWFTERNLFLFLNYDIAIQRWGYRLATSVRRLPFLPTMLAAGMALGVGTWRAWPQATVLKSQA